MGDEWLGLHVGGHQNALKCIASGCCFEWILIGLMHLNSKPNGVEICLLLSNYSDKLRYNVPVNTFCCQFDIWNKT